MQSLVLPVDTGDGHRAELIARIPDQPRARLLWMAGMGLPARQFIPFADALAARGIAVFLHEWRGIGSSNLRASRANNWGYRELFADILASEAVANAQAADMPRIIGGHSLGGQLSACRLGLQPDAADALWLVGSGAPYWRSFPAPARWWLPLAYRFLPWLAHRNGYMPGRRIGFGGNEATQVIDDWARTAMSGRYAARGVEQDIEAGMRRFNGKLRCVTFADDWLAPPSSAAFLTAKLGTQEVNADTLDAASLGAKADHYAWMKQPQAVVDLLLRSS